MKILRYVSDINLEKRISINHPKLTHLYDFKKSIPKDKNYLALLGDIGNPVHNNLKLFFDKITPKYDKIFYIPGNHEYYNLDYNHKSKDAFDKELSKIASKYDNILLMNNKTYMLEDIKIIGTTLWSHIPEEHIGHITKSINDYNLIKKMTLDKKKLCNITPQDTNSWNTQCIAFIEKEVLDCVNNKTKCIILTHHSPLFCNPDENILTSDPKYVNSKHKYAFHNNLINLIKRDPVLAWLYGHTHYSSSFTINDTIISTNQLGYEYEEDIKFNSDAHLDLDVLIKK